MICRHDIGFKGKIIGAYPAAQDFPDDKKKASGDFVL